MAKDGKEKKMKKSKRNDGEASAEKQESAGYQMPPQMMMGMPGAMHPQMPGAMHPQMAMMMGMRGMAMGPRMGMPPMMMPGMGMPPHAGFPPVAPFAPRGGALAFGHARRSKRPPERLEASPNVTSQPAAVTVVESDASKSSSSSSSNSSSSSSSSDAKKTVDGHQIATESTVQQDQGLQVAGHSVPAFPEPLAPMVPGTPSDRPPEEESVAPQVEEPVGGAAHTGASDINEVSMPKKPKPKLGKISFNIQGGSIAAAQAKTQVEEAIAAERARRLNTRDASTQTVRDPENDGEIVTIWRLRPRGMESFPHFPKATKKKAREPKICAAVDAEQAEDYEESNDVEQPEKKLKVATDGMAHVEDDVAMQVASSVAQQAAQKQVLVDEDSPVDEESNDVEQPEKKMKLATDGMAHVEDDVPIHVASSFAQQAAQKQVLGDESEEDSPADDVLQNALAQSANNVGLSL